MVTQKSKYISIADCEICKTIPATATADFRKNESLYSITSKLQDISGDVRKCPICNTFYFIYWQSEPPEGGLGRPEDTSQSIWRVSPAKALDWLQFVMDRWSGDRLTGDDKTNSKIREPIEKEFNLLKERYDDVMQGLSKDLKSENPMLREYAAESFTYHYLKQNNFSELQKLLSNTDKLAVDKATEIIKAEIKYEKDAERLDRLKKLV